MNLLNSVLTTIVWPRFIDTQTVSEINNSLSRYFFWISNYSQPFYVLWILWIQTCYSFHTPFFADYVGILDAASNCMYHPSPFEAYRSMIATSWSFCFVSILSRRARWPHPQWHLIGPWSYPYSCLLNIKCVLIGCEFMRTEKLLASHLLYKYTFTYNITQHDCCQHLQAASGVSFSRCSRHV